MKHGSGIRHRWLINNVSIMMAVVVVLVSLAALTISGMFYSTMRSGLEAKLKSSADFFNNYVSTSDEAFYSGIYRFTQDFDEKTSLELEFLDGEGEILSSSFGLAAGVRPQTADVRGAIDNMEITVFTGRDPQTGERIMAVSGPVRYTRGQVTGVMRLVTSMRLADRQVLILLGGVLLVAVVIILLIWFTGIYFIHSIVTPVGEITETTKRIAAGGYGTQIQKKFAEGEDEIGELARAINNLSLQISQTEKMQSEFLSSVSHELRTPLTAISGWGETLLGGEDMDPDIRRGLTTMLSETRRLSSLVEDLLEFSRIQDGRFKLSVEEQVDLRGVFEDTIFMYGNRLKQEGIELIYEDTDEEIPEISCDPERMKQVFLNILDNAAKYGGSGGRILCDIHADQEEITVVIRDYGPGIPEEELPLVKKKFYRGTAWDPGNARGSGIGLSVCEEIVTMHGGELVIDNADDGQGGCVVSVHMPI